jgi:hypothetical protein
LAFHPYPQLIPSVFNLSGFGPPRASYRASTWPWVDHSASGLEHTTATGYALFRLAFATATPLGLTSRHVTNSQAHSSKGTPSPEQARALTDCKHTVSGTISLPSRGTFHLSLTVLVRYRSLGSIQAYRVVPQIHSRFHGPAATWDPSRTDTTFSSTGLSPSTAGHPRPLRLIALFSDCRP